MMTRTIWEIIFDFLWRAKWGVLAIAIGVVWSRWGPRPIEITEYRPFFTGLFTLILVALSTFDVWRFVRLRDDEEAYQSAGAVFSTIWAIIWAIWFALTAEPPTG